MHQDRPSRRIAHAIVRDDLFYKKSLKRFLLRSFLAGLFRGVGTAIGFSILSAFILYAVTLLASHNLPVIGDLLKRIAEMMKYGV